MDFEKMYGELAMKEMEAYEYETFHTPKKRAARGRADVGRAQETAADGTNPYGSGAAMLSRHTPKTKEEIIERGTARERAALTLADYEAGFTINCERIMTDTERERLKDAARMADTNEEWWEYCGLIDIFHSLLKYSSELTSFYRVTQAEEAELAILCNVWETLQITADRYTEMWERITKDGKGASEETRKFLKETLTGYASEGAEFYFDEHSERVRVMVEGEGMLYERTLRKARDVREKFSALKAAVNVVAEYIYEGGDLILPSGMEQTLSEVWSESYARSLLYSPKYLRSGLADKFWNNEEITEEDEFFAVFPSYFEVEENREARATFEIIAKNLRLTHKKGKNYG